MNFKKLVNDCWKRFSALRMLLGEKDPASLQSFNHLAAPEALIKSLTAPVIMLIGDAYRRAYPEEAELNWTELTGGTSDYDPQFLSVKERRRLLKKLTKEDFATGKIVQIQGWLLGKTEARQCALFSLRRHA